MQTWVWKKLNKFVLSNKFWTKMLMKLRIKIENENIFQVLNMIFINKLNALSFGISDTKLRQTIVNNTKLNEKINNYSCIVNV